MKSWGKKEIKYGKFREISKNICMEIATLFIYIYGNVLSNEPIIIKYNKKYLGLTLPLKILNVSFIINHNMCRPLESFSFSKVT